MKKLRPVSCLCRFGFASLMAFATATQAADARYFYSTDEYYTTIIEENSAVPLGGAFICSGEYPRDPSSPFKDLPRSELLTVGTGKNLECLYFEGIDNSHNLYIRHWYFRSINYNGSHDYVVALNENNAGEFTVNFKRVKNIVFQVKATNNGIAATIANLPEYPAEGLKE